MKMNNKGMTLMELLISIVLISIVLVFLFQILNDLDHETENNNFAYNNQVNRTDVIYTIEKDLHKNTLVGVKDVSSGDTITLEFYFIDSSEPAILKSEYNEYTDIFGDKNKKYYIRYTDSEKEQHSWEMKSAEVDCCALFTSYMNNNSNNYYFKINIPIYNNPLNERNNKEKNNAVDDIEITYAGIKSDLDITNEEYLTISSEKEQKIGCRAD